MIITPAAVTALFTGYKKQYQDAFDAHKPMWPRIATAVPSTTKSNTYGWLGEWPTFREWVGERQFKDMKAHSYTLTNEKFESSIKISRDEIEDDEIGVYSPLVAQMGKGASEFPDELIFGLLGKGFASLCYDGQNYFDSDHPVYPSVDGKGTPTLVSNMQSGGTSPKTPWYLLDTTHYLKPLIHQVRRAPEFKAMTDSKDEQVFLKEEYRYGADMRCKAGFGFWQMGYASQAELTLANYISARTAMMSFEGDGGKKLNIRPNLLVVPPSLEDKALKIVKAAVLAGGESNVYYNTADILLSPYL